MEAQMHRSQGHAHDEVPHKAQFHSSGEDQGEQGIKVGISTALDADPNASKDRPEENIPSNYQTKVTDPTGNNKEEAGTTPLVQSFEKMSVSDETRPEKGTGEAGQEGKNKGSGVSMKEYFFEKFKPQEEDKALSEVISGTLFPKQSKDKTDGTGEAKPTGKATESEDHGSGAAATAGSGRSSGIMDRLKGTATSWFRKAGKTPQTPTSTSTVSTGGATEKEG